MDLAKPENINITHKSQGEGIGSRWGTQAALGKLLNHSEGEVQRTWRAACTLQPIYTFYTQSRTKANLYLLCQWQFKRKNF